MKGALVIFVALLAVGAGVAASADAHRWSALLLHGEPLLLILAVYAAVLARGARRWAIASGSLLACAALRVPAHEAGPAEAPPDWAEKVRACGEEVGTPTGPVRVLQWTLAGEPDLEAVRAVLVAQEAEIAVLHRLRDESVAQAIVGELGGEYVYQQGTAILTRGAFNLCGEEDRWTDGAPSPYAAVVLFAGVTPGTTFPLLVTRMPGPLDAGDWDADMAAARARVTSLLGGLMARSAVVVADAEAPRSYRHLDGAFAAIGLAAVPTPPNWPSRLGRVPLLPLHPYDRLWAGEAWEVALSVRLPGSSGPRAPILTVIRPAERTATSAR